jgi:hypothetical protein
MSFSNMKKHEIFASQTKDQIQAHISKLITTKQSGATI